MNKLSKVLIGALVVVIVGEILIRAGIIKTSGHDDPVKRQENAVTTNEVIDEALTGIGELYTMEYSYTMQSTTTNPLELFGIEMPFGEKKLSYLYSGSLKVGVNLDKADIAVAGKIITVTFPSLIAVNTYDENSVEFYDVKQYSFTKKALENYQASRIANLDDIKARAEELGIYDKAEDNLKEILQNQFNTLLSQVGKEDDYTVRIVFESDDVDFQYDEE